MQARCRSICGFIREHRQYGIYFMWQQDWIPWFWVRIRFWGRSKRLIRQPWRKVSAALGATVFSGWQWRRPRESKPKRIYREFQSQQLRWRWKRRRCISAVWRIRRFLLLVPLVKSDRLWWKISLRIIRCSYMLLPDRWNRERGLLRERIRCLMVMVQGISRHKVIHR